MHRLLLFFALFVLLVPSLDAAESPAPSFMQEMQGFSAKEAAGGVESIGAKLSARAQSVPFLAVASGIFLLAILHTFLAAPFTRMAHHAAHRHHERKPGTTSFKATILHFLGEIEVVFGLWAAVLLAAMTAWYGLAAMTGYIERVNFTEPMFVVVIMALASTRPVLKFAETCMGRIAKMGRGSPAAWWLAILTVGPLLGSFITEPAAMTISAMLLGSRFYILRPRPAFAYATLGLLFVNVSVGGMLTHFAAPPVLMVAQKWGLTGPEMLLHYGWKAIIAIAAGTLTVFAVFRKDFAKLEGRRHRHRHSSDDDLPVPLWITAVHLMFIAWTVFFVHTPALFIGGFLFFLAFTQATADHQEKVRLRSPMLVGFFLAGLVVHGGLQGWWLEPILASLGKWPLFTGATLLTAFNDNAAITYLASQVDGLGPFLKHAVLAGAVTGGGLTVIANAPNPAGQALLGKYFGDGISPAKLLLGALVPTLIVAAALMLLPDSGIEKMYGVDDVAAQTADGRH